MTPFWYTVVARAGPRACPATPVPDGGSMGCAVACHPVVHDTLLSRTSAEGACTTTCCLPLVPGGPAVTSAPGGAGGGGGWRPVVLRAVGARGPGCPRGSWWRPPPAGGPGPGPPAGGGVL